MPRPFNGKGTSFQQVVLRKWDVQMNKDKYLPYSI